MKLNMTLENYIANLQTLKSELPEKVDKIIMKNQAFIVGMLKQRLYMYGTDGNYDLIGQYSKRTKEIKKANNQKSSFITLKDSGRWYAAMYIDSNNGEYIIDSKDWKTPLLIEVYGESILELTFKQQDDIIKNIIEPELQKYINSISGDLEIEL